MAAKGNQIVKEQLKEYVEYKMSLRSTLEGIFQPANAEHQLLLLTTQTEKGRTALHCAVNRRERNAIIFLLRNTDNRYLLIAARDIYGQTSIHHAARNGSSASIKLLLSSLPSIEQQREILAVQDHYGMSALDIACRHNKVEAAVTLNKYLHRKASDIFNGEFVEEESVRNCPPKKKPPEPNKQEIPSSEMARAIGNHQLSERELNSSASKPKMKPSTLPSNTESVENNRFTRASTSTEVTERIGGPSAARVLTGNHLRVDTIDENRGSAGMAAGADRRELIEEAALLKSNFTPNINTPDVAKGNEQKVISKDLQTNYTDWNVRPPAKDSTYIYNRDKDDGSEEATDGGGGPPAAGVIIGDDLHSDTMDVNGGNFRMAAAAAGRLEVIEKVKSEQSNSPPKPKTAELPTENELKDICKDRQSYSIDQNVQPPAENSKYIYNRAYDAGNEAAAAPSSGMIQLELTKGLQHLVVEQRLLSDMQQQHICRLSADKEETSRNLVERVEQVHGLEERVKGLEVELASRGERGRLQERRTGDIDLKFIIILGLLYMNGVSGAAFLLFLYLFIKQC